MDHWGFDPRSPRLEMLASVEVAKHGWHLCLKTRTLHGIETSWEQVCHLCTLMHILNEVHENRLASYYQVFEISCVQPQITKKLYGRSLSREEVSLEKFCVAIAQVKLKLTPWVRQRILQSSLLKMSLIISSLWSAISIHTAHYRGNHALSVPAFLGVTATRARQFPKSAV